MNWKKNQSCATNFSIGKVLEDFPQIGPNRTVKFQSVNNKIFSPCWDLHQASQALESAILIMLQINLNITDHKSLYIVAHIIGQEGKFKVNLNAQWSDVCYYCKFISRMQHTQWGCFQILDGLHKLERGAFYWGRLRWHNIPNICINKTHNKEVFLK